MKKDFIISRSTKVKVSDLLNPVLSNAQQILMRDIKRKVNSNVENNSILLNLDENSPFKDDRFKIKLKKGQLVITSSSSLGIMFGALAVSRSVLKIDNFWYWLDTPIKSVSYIEFSNWNLHLPDYKTKYRGWFVNDELLLMKWEDHESNTYVWRRVFETALRVGCNVIIPGTDLTSLKNRNLASEYGLIIAQHHAEPLGAKMFAREYPNLTASFVKYPDLFRNLWKQAILSQRKMKVIYSLGFRGQGDKPFWLDDPTQKWTDEKIARVINQIIKEQYDLVKKYKPQAPTVINIYGELASLYKAGLLQIPKNVIEIWADSGYGKLVSRRQGSNNPRVPILNVPNPQHNLRGLYYHVAFHDLQASNFLGLLPNSPAFVSHELEKARQNNIDVIELINTGNIKPHILFLREVSKSWFRSYTERSNEQILNEYVSHYYRQESIGEREKIIAMYLLYWQNTIQYGKYSDEKAGDEFSPYLIRKIVRAWVTHSDGLERMKWLIPSTSLFEELDNIQHIIKPYLSKWIQVKEKTEALFLKLKDKYDKDLLYNDLYLSVINQANGLNALYKLIQAYFTANNRKKEAIIQAFLLVDDSVKIMTEILTAEKNNPDPKWRDFYDNDGDDNVPLAVQQLRFMRHYLRTIGDSPDQVGWERRYVKPLREARIVTLLTTKPELSDEVLANKLRENYPHL